MTSRQLAFQPVDATIVVGIEAADVINVAIQLLGGGGVPLTHRASVLAYISDNANGDTISATEHSGIVVIGTDGLLIPILTGAAGAEKAKTIFQLISEADGDIDINITEAGALTRYLVLVLPSGKLVASGAITHAA